MTRSRIIIPGFLGLAVWASAGPATAIELELPIKCDLVESCHVQNYVDVDPGPDAKDFTCGGATYDGHKGVDIRVLSIEAAGRGVEVIAAAAGKVRGMRDGVEERLVASEADRAAVANKECGNGVVLTHEGGIETQYCHMKRGSIRVKTGQEIKVGEVLGEVGLSGLTQFPHVHFEIRVAGKPVDPFTGEPATGACLTDPAAIAAERGLWSQAALRALGVPRTEIIETGFANGQVSSDALEQGRSKIDVPTRASLALVFFVRLINMRKGDRVRFEVSGPDGYSVAYDSDALDRNKAHYVAIAGKKRTGGPWAVGIYRGKVGLVRDGRVVTEAAGELTLE